MSMFTHECYFVTSSKPVIYLVNLSDKDFIRKKNKWLIKIKEWVDKNDPGKDCLMLSGNIVLWFILNKCFSNCRCIYYTVLWIF